MVNAQGAPSIRLKCLHNRAGGWEQLFLLTQNPPRRTRFYRCRRPCHRYVPWEYIWRFRQTRKKARRRWRAVRGQRVQLQVRILMGYRHHSSLHMIQCQRLKDQKYLVRVDHAHDPLGRGHPLFVRGLLWQNRPVALPRYPSVEIGSRHRRVRLRPVDVHERRPTLVSFHLVMGGGDVGGRHWDLGLCGQ